MGEREHDTQQLAAGDRPQAVPALVEEQLESARAGVFRAYVRAREKARHLAVDGVDDGTEERRAS